MVVDPPTAVDEVEAPTGIVVVDPEEVDWPLPLAGVPIVVVPIVDVEEQPATRASTATASDAAPCRQPKVRE